jgi:hypothetical protein
MLGCRRYDSVVWVGSIRTRLGETGLWGCRPCLAILEALAEQEIADADQASLIAR